MTVTRLDRSVSRRWSSAAAVTLALLSMMTWALASPVGSSPDDDFHIANIYCIHDAQSCRSDDVAWPQGTVGWLPDYRDRDLTVYGEVKETYPDLWLYPFPRQLPCYILNGGILVSGDASQPADCLNAEDPADNTPASVDDLDYYPSLNYRLLSLFTQDTIRESVVAWRLVTLTIVVALATGSLLMSISSWRRPLTVAWLVASMPVGMFLFASHNPSALAIAATAAAVGPGVALLRGPWRPQEQWPRVAFLALCSVLVVGSRNEGLGYVAVAALVIVILGLHDVPRRILLRLAIGVGVLVALVVLLGLWRQPVSQITSAMETVSLEGFWDLFVQAGKFVSGSYSTSLGWLEILLPHTVTVCAAAAFWGTIAVGVGRLDGRKTAAFIVAAIVLVAFPFAIELATGNGIQTRYFLPLTFLLVIVAVSPVADLSLAVSRLQWWGLATALIIANTVALLWITVRYVRGIGAGTMSPPVLFDAGAPGWWWHHWLSPATNWAVGSLAYIALLFLLLPLVGGVARGRAIDDDPHPSPPSSPSRS